MAQHGDAPAPPRPGRKRDHSRDADILDAALAVLAEEGYEGMTVDMVAARAEAGKATVYRRWPSKEDLVLDAVARMERTAVGAGSPPDTGTLRGDLMAMMGPDTLVEGERRLRVSAGLVSMMSRGPRFAEAAHAAVVEPWVAVLRTLIERAVARGEVAASVDVDVVATVLPSMAAYQVYFHRSALDADYLVPLIDGVLLPALGLRPAA